jgi:peptide deformylase
VEQISSPRIQGLIDDMVETMRDANGAGIAAPQVHESLRIAIIEVGENPRYPDLPAVPQIVLINPLLTPLVGAPGEALDDHDAVAMYEGCLSVRGIRGRVRRPRKVRVQGRDRHGKSFDQTFEGPAASVFQHECDHLDGILFVDRADPASLCFLDEYARYVPFAERTVDGGAKD